MHTRFETYLKHYRLGWLRPLLEAHLDRFYRRADWVLAPTPSLVEQMMALRGDSSASVWSRGIDRKLFSPARRDASWRQAHGWDEEDIVLLFFGRLVVEKGVDVFAAVVRALQQSDRQVRPLIVGAGPAEQRLRSLPDAVFTGYLQGEPLARAIASADIMLHPSTTETFGNVVLEGMASGLPVICGDAPSARALIVRGETGLICDSLDVAGYAADIAALIDDPQRQRQIGDAAREATAAYSWDAASRSVEEVYRKVLGEGA
jgi:glycosyltransferase involved in cell wall biosynthesis